MLVLFVRVTVAWQESITGCKNKKLGPVTWMRKENEAETKIVSNGSRRRRYIIFKSNPAPNVDRLGHAYMLLEPKVEP